MSQGYRQQERKHRSTSLLGLLRLSVHDAVFVIRRATWQHDWYGGLLHNCLSMTISPGLFFVFACVTSASWYASLSTADIFMILKPHEHQGTLRRPESQLIRSLSVPSVGRIGYQVRTAEECRCMVGAHLRSRA